MTPAALLLARHRRGAWMHNELIAYSCTLHHRHSMLHTMTITTQLLYALLFNAALAAACVMHAQLTVTSVIEKGESTLLLLACKLHGSVWCRMVHA